MKNYLITVVMHDNSVGHYKHSFVNDWDAFDAMCSLCFEARLVTFRRLAA